jgi:predicted negative regulator of RcsB-dependent stress response
MTPRPHSDTESRLEGFEARLQDAFDWINSHGREFMIGLVVVLLAGGIAAGIWEWRRRSVEAAQSELNAIEARFTTDMGANPGELFVPEPANVDQATKARETAVTALDAFSAAHAGSGLAAIAGVKAAELEVDLGKLDAANARLEKVIASLGERDARRAIALRLRGYILDQQGNPMAAGEAYESGGKIESYYARALLFIDAGDCFSRANAPERAIAAYREAVSTSSELAEQAKIPQRIGVEQAKLGSATPPAAGESPAAAPTPAAANP